MSEMQPLVCRLPDRTTLTEEEKARFQNPEVIQEILRTARNVAIVGLSSNPRRPSHFVGTYLKYAGYRIIPVNPKAREILGEKSYPSLLDVPDPVDVVVVFRRPEEAEAIVDQAIAKGARAVWFQLGVVNVRAAEKAEKAGLRVVMDRCMKMEHGRYNGSMHWVGMNTGIITARKPRCRLL